MSEPRCACGAEVHAAIICGGCTRTLRIALANIEAYAADLDNVRARLTKYADKPEGGVTKGKAQPLPIDGRFTDPTGTGSDAEAIARNVVTTWARAVLEDFPSDRAPADSIEACARYLHSRSDNIRTADYGAEVLDELLDVERTLRPIVDAPANRTTFPVGPCPERDEDGELCPGEVRVFIPADERPARMECAACKVVWESYQWLRAGKRILDTKAMIERNPA